MSRGYGETGVVGRGELPTPCHVRRGSLFLFYLTRLFYRWGKRVLPHSARPSPPKATPSPPRESREACRVVSKRRWYFSLFLFVF
ncbi:hypothetical protein BHE74_00038656 [Ensete ventricosum]|nr:hypothetical protein GW17_00019357 [Ensete ventricosum]RWW54742.1 hypothetical protein BHE74_00038656 [Ensete ventricosum]RZS18928.1 hypothetical protein BHM03_00051272 [Ensete ventricosum]